MADPVSWKVVERGWSVVDSAGEEIGKVAEIAGDGDSDIFNGLKVSEGILSRDIYVPAEQVAEIVAGEVRLALDRGGVEALPPYEEPGVQERIVPEGSSFWQRAAAWFRNPRTGA